MSLYFFASLFTLQGCQTDKSSLDTDETIDTSQQEDTGDTANPVDTNDTEDTTDPEDTEDTEVTDGVLVVEGDLLAHWTLDGHGLDRYFSHELLYAREEGGSHDPDAEDRSQSGNYIGVMSGQYSFTPDIGMEHGALFFYGEGSDGWMDGGTIPGSHEDLSVAFWFKAAVVQEQVVVSKFPIGDSGIGWQVRLHDDGQIGFRIGSSENYTELSTSGGFDQFTKEPTDVAYTMGPFFRHLGWTHVVATFSEGHGSIYVNGQLAVENTNIAQSVNEENTSLWLGRANEGLEAEPFHGQVDELKVYRAALNSTAAADVAKILQPSQNISHPVLAHEDLDKGITDGYAAELMSLTEEEARAMVPTNNPEIKQLCPETGAYHPNQHWDWDFTEPNKITSNYNGTSFVYDANNIDPKYANPQVENFIGPLGQTVSIEYFYPDETPQEEQDDDLKFSYKTQIDFHKYYWLQFRVQFLAYKYHQEGNEEYARRVAVVLDQFAQNVQHWIPSTDIKLAPTWYQSSNDIIVAQQPISEPPNTVTRSVGVISENWNGSAREGMYMAKALDLIYESEALKELSLEKGMGENGLRLMIEENFIRDAIDFQRAQQWERTLKTNVPRLFWPMGQMGLMLNRPELIHWFYDIHRQYIYQGWGFTSDMHSNDSAKAVAQLSIYENILTVDGYSDYPDDYRNPINNKNFVDLDMVLEMPEFRGYGVEGEEEPLKYTLLNSTYIKHFPNGVIPQINDTPQQDLEEATPLTESTSEILYGWGHALLGDGTGDEQVQAHLHFQGGGGHTHMAGLGLIFNVFNREILGDIGYQRNILRKLANSTLSHNTVTVNRSNQLDVLEYKRLLFGNAELFVPDMPGLKVMRVDNHKVYAETTDYRRTLLLMTHDITRPYLIDIFQVTGGETHDYHLRGGLGTDQDQLLPADDLAQVTALPLTPIDEQPTLSSDPNDWLGPAPMLEGSEVWDVDNPTDNSCYGLLRRMAQGVATEDFTLNYKYIDGSNLGSRHHVVQNESMEVFLGQSPRLRQLNEDDDSIGHILDEKVYNEWTPHLVLRTEGDPVTHSTTFIVVHEPYSSSTPNDMVVTQFETGAPTQIGLKVEMGDRVDTYLLSLGDAQEMSASGLTVDGIIGVHTTDGVDEYGWLVGGTSLEKGSVSLSSATGHYEGSIQSGMIEFLGEESDSFDATSSLPEGSSLSEGILHVTHGTSIDGEKHFIEHVDQDPIIHAYPIESVESLGSTTQRIHLDGNHGLLIDGNITRERHFPDLTFEGINTFKVYTNVYGP